MRDRTVRYIVAAVAFITTVTMSLVIGILLGAYVTKLSFPPGRAIIVTGFMAVASLLPAYIVK